MHSVIAVTESRYLKSAVYAHPPLPATLDRRNSPFMPTAKEYRQYAELCERIAAESYHEQEKAILRRIATQWRRLANIKVKEMARQEKKNSD